MKYKKLFIALLLVFFGPLLLVVGCFYVLVITEPYPQRPVTRFTDDYLVMYEDFLQHSLGDFEVIGHGERWNSSSNTYSLWWEVEFIDETGAVRTFLFSNGSRMGSFVTGASMRHFGRDMLAYEVREELLEESDYLERISVALRFQYDRLERDVDFSLLTNPTYGIQLSKNWTAQQLLDEWDFNLYINLVSWTYDLETAIYEMETTIRTFADYFNQNVVYGTFTIWLDGERHFNRFVYEREANQFMEAPPRHAPLDNNFKHKKQSTS